MNQSVWKRAEAGIFLTAMLVTSLTACGGSSNADAQSDSQQNAAASTSSAETVTVAMLGTPARGEISVLHQAVLQEQDRTGYCAEQHRH